MNGKIDFPEIGERNISKNRKIERNLKALLYQIIVIILDQGNGVSMSDSVRADRVYIYLYIYKCTYL